MRDYSATNDGCCLLCDYAKLESEKQDRIVCENDEFICVVPWWAVWPFETLIWAKHHLRHLGDFSNDQRFALAELIRNVTCRYDNMFQSSFPYSMGIHQAPVSCDTDLVSLSHFHMHFYPPLLRSATVKKFQVGFEMMAMPQRDLTPEQAAEKLRMCEVSHYLETQE